MASEALSAVVGASGFIGSRLVEWLVLSQGAPVRPIVRSFRGMARMARFDLDCRIANATDDVGLQTELSGCDVVFHCAVGDRETVIKSAEATYRAAAAAGVRRIVYLSSSVVHGFTPEPGTHDDSDLLAGQSFTYNESKVVAEQRLRQLREDGRVEVVVLRPSIVFGPRSQAWTAQIATDLLRGSAYLVDDGRGICNTVYVDNLVGAMWQAAWSEHAANQDFIITDGERVTWHDLYAAVADAVGVDMASVTRVDSTTLLLAERASKAQAHMNMIRSWPSYRAARRLLPTMVRWARPAFTNVIVAATPVPLPPVDQEIAALQRCECVLPIAKAQRLLGYTPAVSFAEGCRRSAAWLRFASGVST